MESMSSSTESASASGSMESSPSAWESASASGSMESMSSSTESGPISRNSTYNSLDTGSRLSTVQLNMKRSLPLQIPSAVIGQAHSMDIKGWPPSLSPSFFTCSLCNRPLSEPESSRPKRRRHSLDYLIPGLIIIDELARGSLHYSSMIVNFSCSWYLKYYMFFPSCKQHGKNSFAFFE